MIRASVLLSLLALISACNSEERRQSQIAEQIKWDDKKKIEMEEHLRKGTEVLSETKTDYGIVSVLKVSTEYAGMKAHQVCTVFINRNGNTMNCNEPDLALGD